MNEPLLKPRDDLTDLPLPGEIVIYDYTEPRQHLTNSTESKTDFRVRAVQWNIERAYKLDEIIDLLARGSTGYRDHRTGLSRINRKPRAQSPAIVDLEYKNFDVMAIQEFDINCARSDYRNSPLELARALKMKCIFLCEFEEIYSEKLRNRRTQGGGVHGNGILTWWDVEKIDVIEHVEIFAWEADGEKLNEPRKGKRRSLACFLRNPLNPNQKMIVYSVHLEVFCGIFGRLRQFSQILAHSCRHIATHPHQMILGDLNTMAHGLARFLPKYCCDGMRWRSVGWSEAEWWQRNLFAVTPEIAGTNEINCFLAAHHHPSKPHEFKGEIANLIECELEDEIENGDGVESDTESEMDNVTESEMDNINETDTQPNNAKLQSKHPIFTPKELQTLINPHFFCPFPVSSSKTVEMHGYSGKLDWMLLRNWRVEGWGLDNEAYWRSDHKLLWSEVVSYADDAEGDEGREAHDYHMKKGVTLSTDSILGRPNLSSILFANNSLFLRAGLIGITTGIILYYTTTIILKKQ